MLGINGARERLAARAPAPILDISQDGSQIVYARSITRNGQFRSDLVVASMRSGKTRVLRTSFSLQINDARWSPDGTKIALGVLGGCGIGAVWVINADGSDLHNVSNCGELFSWSADGASLAFATMATRKLMLGVARVADSQMRLLVPWAADRWLMRPVWSPQGDVIAYTTGFNRGYVHVVTSDGSRDTTIAAGIGTVWSPDGHELLANRYGSSRANPRPHWSISVVNRSGSMIRELSPGKEATAAWARRGGIAYSRADAFGRDQIFLIRPKELRSRQLTHYRSAGEIDRVLWTAETRLIYRRTRCEDSTP